MACSYSGHLNCVKLLLEHEADIMLKNNDKRTAHDIAQKQGHMEIVNILRAVRTSHCECGTHLLNSFTHADT